MKVTAENIGKPITITAYINEANKPHPIITRAAFECRACMRIYEAKQTTDTLRQPNVCTECGGETFKLLPMESDWTDRQELQALLPDVGYMEVRLRGCQCDYRKYMKGIYSITGTLKVDMTTDPYRYYLDEVTDIHRRRK